MTDEYGVVIEPGVVRMERVLPGPIERVWQYLTDAEKRSTWFCGGEIEPKVGGRAALVFDHRKISVEPIPEKYAEHVCGNNVTERTVTQYEPPRLLGYTWGDGVADNSEVTFELTPQGEKVLLVLTHRRLPNRDEMVNVSGGWHQHFGILEDRLLGQEPRPFWSGHATLEKEYAKRIRAEDAPST